MIDGMNTEKLICIKLIEMMEKRPYYEIKVTDLVRYAGISRSSFYTYFDSIFSVLQKIEDDFIEGMPEEHYINYKTMKDDEEGRARFEYIKKNIKAYRVLTGPNGDPSFDARLANRNRRVIDNLKCDKNLKISDLEKQLLNEFFMGGKTSIFRWWSYHVDDIEVDEMLRVTKEIINTLFDHFGFI